MCMDNLTTLSQVVHLTVLYTVCLHLHTSVLYALVTTVCIGEFYSFNVF